MEEFRDEYLGSEDMWRYLFSVSTRRYLLKILWNISCLILVLCFLPSERERENDREDELTFFHPYSVKLWLLYSTLSLLAVTYISYYFGTEGQSLSVWSLGRLVSVRQVWGGTGIGLLLTRIVVLIDEIHTLHAKQSPLTAILDTVQFLFWTSLNFPFPITFAYCFIEASIHFLRLWRTGIAGSDFHEIGTAIIILYMITTLAVSYSNLVTIRKSSEALQGIRSISVTKHQMVHLLCTVILTPIHTIVEAIRNIDLSLQGFRVWNNKIITATNQVVLYSNNFLMLVRIEEGRFQFECINTIHVHTLLDSVISRLPILGEFVSSDPNALGPPSVIVGSIGDTIVRSDSKAVSFILENVLTYCLNVTRRKAVELKGRLRRQVQFHEFQPISVSMTVLSRNIEDQSHLNLASHYMQFIITFGVTNSVTNVISKEVIQEAIDSADSKYDVRIQSALDEIKQPRYLHDRLNTHCDEVEQPDQPTRQSTILMTVKQMLDSCGGSLRLLEIVSPNSVEFKSAGEVNVLIACVPCILRDDLAQMIDKLGRVSIEPVRGKFDFGILVTDNMLSEHVQRLFHQCHVKCCRITNNNRIPLNNYAAIVIDSLGTYARLRVKGFRGKVVIMSAAAVYIDGNSSQRNCDYVLPVPCELSDVHDLIHSFSHEDVRQVVRLPNLLPMILSLEELLRSYSSIPIIYFFSQLIGALKDIFLSAGEKFQDLVQWLRLRTLSLRQKERERNEFYQLGRQYDLLITFYRTSFLSDVESDYLKWRMFHTPPFWNESSTIDSESENTTFALNSNREYTPTSQDLIGLLGEHKYVSPACLFFLFVHVGLVLMLISQSPRHNPNWMIALPLIVLIPLVGTIYFFNLKKFRKMKLSELYWIFVQLIVLVVYILLMVCFFDGPRGDVASDELEMMNFSQLMSISVGHFKLDQLICFCILAPLISKSICLASFPFHSLIKTVFAVVTITAIILCFSVIFHGRSATLTYVLLFPAFPFLHQTSISQYWMRKWYQNTQKFHFSQTFIAKCTEIVWKELRYPLKTLIDYHDEYLAFTAQKTIAQELMMSSIIMQYLTTYRLGNLLLLEIQTVLRPKESLDTGRGYSTETKNRVMIDLRDELSNLGRVFESESPVAIKTYFRKEQTINRYLMVDRELLVAVLVNVFSQSVACIKSKVNSKSRELSMVHEIVVTLSVYVDPDSKGLFLKFEVMDSGSQLTATGNENSIFQEEICRRCVVDLGGRFERFPCFHSVYRNIMIFSLPISGHQSSSLWKASSHESGWRHKRFLEKYLLRKNLENIETSRYRSRLGRHILIVASGSKDIEMISKTFRMQKWECYEVKCLNQLAYYFLNNSNQGSGCGEVDLDVILVETHFNQQQAFGEEDMKSLATKMRNYFGEDVCLVGLVNNKNETKVGDGYDLIISRPIMDNDLREIVVACDKIAMRSLLWLK